MEFGRYLEELIIRRGLSLRELGKRAGISHSSLSLVINGKRGAPTPENLLKLAPHLDVTYLELMKAAGYVMPEEEFTSEEINFLSQLDEGVSILELLKLKPTLDGQKITLPEMELAADVIRSLRKTKENS